MSHVVSEVYIQLQENLDGKTNSSLYSYHIGCIGANIRVGCNRQTTDPAHESRQLLGYYERH
jgi:hypothetical protein